MTNESLLGMRLAIQVAPKMQAPELRRLAWMSMQLESQGARHSSEDGGRCHPASQVSIKSRFSCVPEGIVCAGATLIL
jgi:hypothetical protein